MTASELKHQAALARWKDNIADCRGRGMSVEKRIEQPKAHRPVVGLSMI